MRLGMTKKEVSVCVWLGELFLPGDLPFSDILTPSSLTHPFIPLSLSIF